MILEWRIKNNLKQRNDRNQHKNNNSIKTFRRNNRTLSLFFHYSILFYKNGISVFFLWTKNWTEKPFWNEWNVTNVLNWETRNNYNYIIMMIKCFEMNGDKHIFSFKNFFKNCIAVGYVCGVWVCKWANWMNEWILRQDLRSTESLKFYSLIWFDNVHSTINNLISFKNF